MSSRTAELIAKLVDDVSGPAKKITGSLKGTAASLEALKAKAGKIDAFRQANRQLDDASLKFRVAQQNVRKLTTEMAGAGGGKAAAALSKAERQAAAAADAFKAQGARVRELRSALEAAGVPVNDLRNQQRKLQAQIEMTTSALQRQQARAKALPRASGTAGGLERVSRRSAGLGGRSAGLGGSGAGSAIVGASVARFGATAAGIGGAAYVVGDGIRRATKSSMDFERTLIEVGKATDAKGPELDGYAESLMRLARETGKTKEELGSMLASAGFAGRPKKELMDFTEYSAKAMVAWQTSAEDTGQALAEIGNIFEANQKRIEQVGDAINTMADNSASRESDLLEFMRRAGASGRQAGISAEELLAFGAAMKEVGVRNETAGTAMEAMLNVMKLGAEFSKKAGEGLKALGLDSTKMRKAFVAKPVETLVDLLERLNKMPDPLKRAEAMTNLFGKEYQDDAAKLINQLPKLREYIALMRDRAKIAAGGVRAQFAENIDKDVSKIDRASQAIDVLMKRSGDYSKAALGGLAEDVNKFVDRLEKGDTLLQRIMTRLKGSPGKGSVDPKNVEDLDSAWTKRFEDAVDAWIANNIGATGDDAKRLNREGAAAGRDAEVAERRGRLQALEEDIENTRSTMKKSGRSDAQIDGVLRSKRAQLAALKREAELAAQTAEKKPPSMIGMGLDPNAAPSGQPGQIGPGQQGFGKQYPLLPTDPKAVPHRLPPERPGSLPRGIDGINDVLSPKVDTSSLDAAKAAAENTKTSLDTLSGVSVSPTVDAGSIISARTAAEALLATLRAIPGAASAATSSIATATAGAGRLKSALAGANSD